MNTSNKNAQLLFALSCPAAIALTIAAYSNSFHNSFHFDDSHVIVGNAFIRSLNNIPLFFTDARTFSSLPSNATWRPLLSVSYAIDYRLGGSLDPFWFHVTQFSLHLLLGGLLFFFFRILMDEASPNPANRFVALFASTLFCIHTVNTETLNLISARSDLVSTLAVVVAFLLYLKSPRCRRYHVYLIPIVVGALAKAPVVFFAPLLFAYVLIYGRPAAESSSGNGDSRTLGAAIRAALPAVVVGALLLWLLNRMNSPDWTPGSFDRIGYLRTQPFIWLHYFRIFFVPLGLTADTDLVVIPYWYDTRVVAGLTMIALLLWTTWKTSHSKEHRPIAFGLAWFAIALLPASSFFPLAEVANEHRVYFPYIGLSLAVVWWCALLLRRSSARAVRVFAPTVITLGIVALTALAVGTYHRNRVWRSEETLWRDVVEKSPGNARGLMNYGLTQMAQGRFGVARDHFERASRLAPAYSTLEINLGVVEGAMGNHAAAEPHFRRALELSRDVSGHYYYARWLVERGRCPEAIDHLAEATRLSPGAEASRELLMNIRAALGETHELQRLAREALSIDPENKKARGYLDGISASRADADYDALFATGMRAGREKRPLEAAGVFRSCLVLRPDSADAWNNLGFYLGEAGFFAEAREALGKAIALRPDNALTRNNLNWVIQQEVARRKR